MTDRASLGRIFRTVRHLKPIQIANHVQRRLPRPVQPDLPAPDLRRRTGHWAEPIRRQRSWDGEARFTFLNQSHCIDGGNAWNAAGFDKLWLYNLHYFDDLLEPGFACRVGQHRELIERWIAENPPPLGNGWEPYPLSLRIVNWIKWHLETRGLDSAALRSLATQVRHLTASLEYHLLGNHLLANAKALAFAGLFFEGPQASRWLRQGQRVLDRQLPEQILADGAHCELSPTYHAAICEDLLDLVNLGRWSQAPPTQAWERAGRRLLTWLVAVVRPDGQLPLFNDAAYGVSPTVGELLDYAARLGLPRPDQPEMGLCVLESSGYVRCASPRLWALFDYGQAGPDYNPGHAHCDMFSFELAVDRMPVIVDTGTSTYSAGPLRLSQRGTAAHNTVQFGTHEQSEVWAAFRMGRRARILNRRAGTDWIEAAHTGYRRLGVDHWRRTQLSPDRISITDELRGPGAGEPATARFHFHPSIQPRVSGRTIDFGPGRLAFDNAREIVLETYGYAPQFNVQHPALVASVSFAGRLETKIVVGSDG